MHVYNVGQANCILVTVDNADQRPHPGKSAIFFDTGAQNEEKFRESAVKDHIKRIINDNSITNVWFVLSHTDSDHTNVFDSIAEICQNAKKPINGVMVVFPIISILSPKTHLHTNKEKKITPTNLLGNI
jgi:beta-lactamase superfamily II metal-dependent hydrolase